MKLKNLHSKFLLPLFVFLISIILINSGEAQTINPPVCYSGNRLLREFIDEEMIYPDRAMQAGEEGTVEIAFVVQPDGSVTDIKVVRKVAPDIDQEAVRIFRHILWHPATELGKPIAFRHYFKIKFNIRKYQKLTRQRGAGYFERPHEAIDSSFRVYRRNETDQWPKPLFSRLDRDLTTFLINNLKYPDAAMKQNISGIVKLRFVIETSGRISNIEVIEGVGAGCTEEAIRVLRLMKWYPAVKDGIAVRTTMPFEIHFDTSNKSVGGAIPNPGQVY